MQRQSKRMAGLFAVFLALCGIYYAVWAQTPTAPAPEAARTYVWQREFAGSDTPAGRVITETVVVRLQQGGVVSGAFMVSQLRNDPPAALVFDMKGSFNPDSGVLKANLAAPAGRGPNSQTATLNGEYIAVSDAIVGFLTTYDNGVEIETQTITLTAYKGAVPLVIGVWQWEATDSTSSTAVEFISGEFYILEQSTDGKIRGLFSRTAQDTGAVIAGEVKSVVSSGGTGRIDRIEFNRSIRRADGQGLALEQLWSGDVGVDGTIQNGFIEQKIPGIWNARWTARLQ